VAKPPPNKNSSIILQKSLGQSLKNRTCLLKKGLQSPQTSLNAVWWQSHRQTKTAVLFYK
jgi:hypothetical protein